MNSKFEIPEYLKEKIVRDLSPVKPLPPPRRRALIFLILGILLLVWVPLTFGVRHDSAVLGFEVLWGLSIVELLYGCFLMVIALRAAVPGRSLGAPRNLALTCIGIALLLGAILLTRSVSDTVPPAGRVFFYWRACFVSGISIGLPVLFLALFMVFRAYPLHPVAVGTICGLGAGLIVEAGWRTYCEVSSLVHVFSAHVAYVVGLTILGAALGTLWKKRYS